MRKEVTHCRKVLICKRCLYDLNLKQDGGYFRPITFRNLFQLVLIKIKLLNLESLYILLPYLRTSNPANLKFSKNKPPKGVWKVSLISLEVCVLVLYLKVALELILTKAGAVPPIKSREQIWDFRSILRTFWWSRRIAILKKLDSVADVLLGVIRKFLE